MIDRGNASRQSGARENPDTIFWTVISLLCLIIALLPFVLPAIPIGTDAYKHLMVARVLADFDNPFLRYSDYFSVHWRPVSTVLGDLTLAAFVRVFSPIAALKAYFIAFAAGFWLSGRYYLKQLGHSGLVVILLLPLLHSFYVFSAFLPFIGAIALFPLLLAVLIGSAPGLCRSAWLALILIALYGFHLVGAVVGCFAVVLFAINDRPPRLLWGQLLAIVPCAGLVVYYAVTKPRDAGPPLFHGPLGQIKAYIGYNIWSLSPTASYLFVALLALFTAAIVWQARGGTILHARLLVLSIMLVTIGLFMPYQIGGEFVVGPRTLPFAFIAAVGALKWNARFLRASTVLVCMFLAISSTLNTSKELAVQPSYRVFLSGMPTIKPGSKVLPIIEDLTLGGNKYIQPFNSVEDLYNIYRGGANPYVFAEPLVGNGANLLRSKYAPGIISKFARNSQRIDYRGVSKDYDYVICWGRLPAIKPTIASEAPLVFENGLLSIYSRSR